MNAHSSLCFDWLATMEVEDLPEDDMHEFILKNTDQI